MIPVPWFLCSEASEDPNVGSHRPFLSLCCSHPLVKGNAEEHELSAVILGWRLLTYPGFVYIFEDFNIFKHFVGIELTQR